MMKILNTTAIITESSNYQEIIDLIHSLGLDDGDFRFFEWYDSRNIRWMSKFIMTENNAVMLRLAYSGPCRKLK